MKKILQLITVLTLLFTAVESKAQIVDGNLSPDWTLTDLNGVSQHLYSYLNAGKTVVIDISAAWCGPCWSYHNGGALDQLWAANGPLGGTGVSASTTDDIMVFLIEGELTNLPAQIHGITGTALPNTGYNNSTQGDWTLNTDYPIIDLPNGAVLSDYNLHYFPTCVMICPDRTMTEVDQWTAAQLYTQRGHCATAISTDDAQLMQPITVNTFNSNLQSCDSVIPTFRIGNLGTSALTSATITYNVDGVTQKVKNWTGNLAPYNNTTVGGVKLGGPVAGGHVITATLSNPNGGTDPSATNNATTASFVNYATTPSPLVVEDFETSGFPSNWVVFNGGDPATWTTGNVGFNSNQSAKLDFYNLTAGDIDYFALDPMSFWLASSASLTFDVSYAQYSSTVSDKLEVDVSTNCGSTWTPKYIKIGSALSTNGTTYITSQYIPTLASQWRHETINLNTYAGQTDVLVRFKGVSAQGNNVYVDNINFSMTTGIDELSSVSDVTVYPNPTADNANVNFNLSASSNVSIALTNQLGQQVIKSELGNLSTGIQNYTLKTEGLNSGLYFLSIKTATGTITKKVSVNR